MFSYFRSKKEAKNIFFKNEKELSLYNGKVTDKQPRFYSGFEIIFLMENISDFELKLFARLASNGRIFQGEQPKVILVVVH